MRPVERVLEHVEGVEERANGWWALCPAHDDHDPSLHVEEGEDGSALFKCRAGCDQADVMDALERRGLKRRDLFAGSVGTGGSVVQLNGRSRAARRPRKVLGRLAKTWEVKDTSGALVALHERYEDDQGGKECLWRRYPGQKPASLEGMPVADLPLYGSELVAGWPEGAAVVLVEGEPATDALWGAKIQALGTVTGASGAPSKKVLEILLGRPVVIWPDSDPEGREHMRRVAARLQGIAAAVHWYEWEGAPEKGDAADHPAVNGGSREALDQLVRELRAAPEWRPDQGPVAGVPPSTNSRGAGEPFGGFNLTDLGNSERFVADHGEDVRFCYPWGKWLVWTGARWERDEAGRVHRLAKETVRGIYEEAAAEEDEGRRKALAQHATKSEAEAKIKAMLELAKSEVPVSPDELDADPWLLNAPNGTVDLRTGERRPHRREDLLMKMAGAEYRPDAEAPEWAAFLERVLPGEDLRAFVRRAAGYSATGDTSEQVMFINHGVGANGKSTFQEALADALGDYATRTPTEMLLAKRAGGIPNDVARLKGARLVTASETEQGRRLAESLVKDLTGQDTITARFMRAEFFDFKPTHKLWLSTNHKPEIRGTDNAIWRRIRLIPWAVTIPPTERDHKLPGKLRDELPGVLAWAVRGYLEWQHQGLGVPEEVRSATEDYRAEMDVLAAFFEDRCVIAPQARVKATPLYLSYKAWCDEAGEQPDKQRAFGMRLTERGFERKQIKGMTWYTGIAMRDERPDPDGGVDDKRATEGGTESPSSAQIPYPVEEGPSSSTPQNPRKPHESREWVDEGRPKNGINAGDSKPREVMPINGLPSSTSSTPDARSAREAPKNEFTKDRPTPRQPLTEEEAHRVQKLISEGMAPKFARAEVLGQGKA